MLLLDVSHLIQPVFITLWTSFRSSRPNTVVLAAAAIFFSSIIVFLQLLLALRSAHARVMQTDMEAQERLQRAFTRIEEAEAQTREARNQCKICHVRIKVSE